MAASNLEKSHEMDQEQVCAAAAPTPQKERDGGVRLTIGSFFCGLFLLCIAVPLAYLGGIMTGRGHEAAKRQEAVRAMQQRASASETAPASAVPDNSMEGQGILGAAELSFARSLRLGPGEKLPAKPKAMVPAVEPGAADSAEPKMAPGMSPAVPQGPPQPPAQKADLFDFVYQTAAFKTMQQAEKLRIRIEEKGYRCRIEQSGRLFVVNIRVRGAAEKFDDVRRDMQSLGLGVPMERSRRPVFRPQGQR